MKRFRCLFCDRCCFFEEEKEYPTVYPWEKRRLEQLAERRGLSLRFEPLMIYEAPGEQGLCVVAMYRWVIRGYCPFFDRETRRCTIHGEKPLACRMYPLIIEMPSGNLMVSGKCDWVRRQGLRLLKALEAQPELIPKVFPEEFNAAKQAFADFVGLTSLAERLRLRPLANGEKCSAFIDIDLYARGCREAGGDRDG